MKRATCIFICATFFVALPFNIPFGVSSLYFLPRFQPGLQHSSMYGTNIYAWVGIEPFIVWVPLLTELYLASLRFFRICLKMNNSNLFRHLEKVDIFTPIINLTTRELRRNNLLSSTCQEFFETIRKVCTVFAVDGGQILI